MKLEEIKKWFAENKTRILLMGGVVILTPLIYVLFGDKKISFSKWLEIASTEELDEVYEKMRLESCKTGIKPIGMEAINRELGHRGAKEWFEKHPPNLDQNFRWTDANPWE